MLYTSFYTVMYMRVSSLSQTNELSLVVTMLTPGTMYSARVASRDQAGFMGPFSSPYIFTTPSDGMHGMCA